jgi:transglutaminase-like putative cysteine protease
MLIEVRHLTRYRYRTTTRYGVQSLRLTPPTFDSQRIVIWTIKAPGIERSAKFRDGFGNLVHLVTTADPHDGAEIEASGVVETTDHAGVVRGLLDPAPRRVFLRETDKTKPDAAIRDIAAKVSEAKGLTRLHALMRAVNHAIAYEPGSTHQHTSAAEALADGKGVCQDHAHVFIAAARALGTPARYVNGYILSGSAGPAEAHHAWAEAWVEDLGWVGFDAANNLCPTESYVRLATGLDAATAAPIRGAQRGGEEEVLDVIVEVQQQSGQQ